MPYHLILIAILFILLVPSQTLSTSSVTFKTWGGPFNDSGRSVAKDNSGNSYLVGSTDSFGVGGSDAFLVKYNSSNSLVWQRTWGGRLDDFGLGVATNSGGESYVAGYSCSFSVNCDSVLLRFNSSGGLMWQKSWGASRAVGINVAVGPSGGAYVTGELGAGYSGSMSTLIERFDSSGSLIWARNWSGISQAFPFGIASDPAGDVNIAGETQITSPSVYRTYAFLLHFNPFGDLLWDRIWVSKNSASSPQDAASGVAVDSVGDIFVSGITYATQTIQGYQVTSRVTFLSKYNSTGSLSWEKLWYPNNGLVNEPTPGSIGTDSSGNVYVTTYSPNTLLMLNPDGILLAQQAFNGLGSLSLASNVTSNVSMASTVSSAPPYPLCGITGTTHNVNVTQVAGSFTTGTPSISLIPLSGNVTAPTANQSYGGGNDAALISYNPQNVGIIPSCFALAISPILYLTTFILVAPLIIRARKRA